VFSKNFQSIIHEWYNHLIIYVLSNWKHCYISQKLV
jgi:hypothetical protein